LALMRENIDFVPFFEGIIDRFEMNKGSKIQFIRQIPNESYIVWIDRDRMTQVVDNIISNAVKYSPEGGNITLKVEKRMSEIVARIRDEGFGIANNKPKKIFQRFYRDDKARTRQLGGIGLGLGITLEIMVMHYGRIWAE